MMQGLLYKVPDPRNTTYLRKYVSSMPNPVPELVNRRLENEDIDLETLSLAGLHEKVVTAIQEECVKKKVAKSLKKQLNLSSATCDIFKETSNYGCFKPKPKPKSTKSSSCTCHNSLKRSKPTKFKKAKGFKPKRKFFFKKRRTPSKPRHSNCFICKKPGHWASQCPLWSKTKTQVKVMTIFQHHYNPAEWDMVDDRPEGEYFSLSEVSTEDERESPTQSLCLTSASPSSSSSDSDSDSPSLLHFLDIKMFGTTPDLSSLLRKREELTSKLSMLSPGQFFLIDYYSSQLQTVNAQISSLQ